MEELLKAIEGLNKKYKSVSPDLTDELRTLYKMVRSKKNEADKTELSLLRLHKEYAALYESITKAHEAVFAQVVKGGIVDVTK